MDQFKNNLFLKLHGYPIQFQSISESEKIDLTEFVKLNINSYFTADQFFILCKQVLNRHIAFEDLSSSKHIEQAINELGISDNEVVYVIWNYPDDVDKVDLNYLIKYWDDIWFGPSDDIIALFFPNSNKLILITHWNIIYY